MGASSAGVGQINRRKIPARKLDNCFDGIKSNAGALIYSSKTKRYLFLLRNSSKFAGTWAIPGGKIESGERVIEAVHREIQEEIGVDLSLRKTIPIETFTSNDKKFVYFTFLVTVEDEFSPILNNEHCGYCWVNLDKHPRPLHPGVWRTFNFKVIINKITALETLL